MKIKTFYTKEEVKNILKLDSIDIEKQYVLPIRLHLHGTWVYIFSWIPKQNSFKKFKEYIRVNEWETVTSKYIVLPFSMLEEDKEQLKAYMKEDIENQKGRLTINYIEEYLLKQGLKPYISRFKVFQKDEDTISVTYRDNLISDIIYNKDEDNNIVQFSQ